MTLKSVIGNLRDMYRYFDPESILHVDQLMNERRTNPVTPDGNLREQSFQTADGQIYFLQGKNNVPTLAITRGSFNPLFQDSKIDEYCKEMAGVVAKSRDSRYYPTPDETLRALHAEDTVVVDLTKLRLQGNNAEFIYLAIDTSKYHTLNSEEQKLAQRVYGQDDNFTQTMTMLADAGIRETQVYVLNPYDVGLLHNYRNNFSAGWASVLRNFKDYSIFTPMTYYCDHASYSSYYLEFPMHSRGVRRGTVAQSFQSDGYAIIEPESPVPTAPAEIKVPDMEEILALSRKYFPPHNLLAFEKDLRERYKP